MRQDTSSRRLGIRQATALPLIVLVAGLVACNDDTARTVGPTEPGASAAVASTSVAVLAGAWNWSNEEFLRLPPDVATMMGVVPEGRNTIARCESAGAMNLVQTGDEFQGTAFKTFNACETKGGQAFQQPGIMFQVADGRIRGGTAHFSFHGFLVRPCPHQVVVSTDQSGTATALSGTGRCLLPGHPQSESPVDLPPPPRGSSKTLAWEAVRTPAAP